MRQRLTEMWNAIKLWWKEWVIDTCPEELNGEFNRDGWHVTDRAQRAKQQTTEKQDGDPQ